MFQKILVATDLVTVPDVSVMAAEKLAEQNNSKLYLLHVLESASVKNRSLIKHFQTGEEILTNAEYEKVVRETIELTYANALKSCKNYEIRITVGFPWEEILRCSREEDTNLIVLSPHSGRAGEKGVVRTVGKVGSTVEGVIMRENCPVMIINNEVRKEKMSFKKVLICIDYSNSCECALFFGVKLSQYFNSKISVFHMLPMPPYPKYSRDHYETDVETTKKRLKDFCHGFLDGTDHEYDVKVGVLPHQEILQCARKKDADLIVLGSHTKVKAGKWYAGSVVERVAYRAECPVIVVTDPTVLLTWDGQLEEKIKMKKDADRVIRVFTKT